MSKDKTTTPVDKNLKKRTVWRWLGGIVLAGLVAVALFLFWPASMPDISAAQARLPKGQELVERGKYLATAADCVACHIGPSGVAYAGGRPFVLPFGTLYSPNITPDEDAGIGQWTDAEFVRAVRHGVNEEGENLYPAFSYPSYALMTDEDALAIRAFLATVPKSSYVPPDNAMMFPFNQRYVMRFWNLLFLPSEPMKAYMAKSDEWNRGAYLVNALAHCGECHTPRNLMFGMNKSRLLGGSEMAGWKFYNITPDTETGIGKWTPEAMASYLSTGHAEGHGSAGGGMGEAVNFSLRHLKPEDIKAIVTYLRDIPAQKSSSSPVVAAVPESLSKATLYGPGPEAAPQSGSSLALGKSLFEGACASCHGWNGKGVELKWADLAGSRAVNDEQASNLMQVLLSGSHMTGPKGEVADMPRFQKNFDDREVAALANFMISHFGGKQGQVTPADAAAARKVAN